MGNYAIVGGTSGISKELVQLLMDKGHHVFMMARSAGDSAPPAGVAYEAMDILSDPIPEGFLPEILDGLVYSPGSMTLKPFKRIDLADFLDDYEVNVGGAIKLIQACLPALRKSESSSIVLFSTVAVNVGMPFHSLVSSSKGALEGLTRSLAAEFAPIIRVNAIAPSLTDTPLSQRLLDTDEKKTSASARHPLKRVGSTVDIANAAYFLLSQDSSWITGQILGVDGGLSTLRI